MGLLCLAQSAAGQLSPNADWHSLKTEHFYVHFTPPLEPLARRIAGDAERAYAQLSRELHPPRGMIDVVLSDDADFSNGFTTVFPTNRIVIYANPPVSESALRYTNDWGQLVITHELTHVFHLDRSRGVWSLAQRVFGRAPTLFPNLYAPAWITEGLAVYYESRLTGAGRIEGSEHRMIVRAAALDQKFPSIGQPSLAYPGYPFGESAYAYGSLFMEYLAETRGEANVGRFVEKESADLIPYLIDIPARQAFGVSFSQAWRDWRDSVERSVAGDERHQGFRDLTTEGIEVAGPRWMGVGAGESTLVYDGTNGRDIYSAFRVDTLGHRQRLGRRNSASANVLTPSGDLLFSQLELVSPYQIRSDLWLQRGSRQSRLTRGERLSDPDVRGDGAIVAVQITPGATRLVRVSPDGQSIQPLTTGSYDEQWTEPRWSHDGRHIAAVRWLRGDVSQIVVLDTLGTVRQIVSSGHSVEATPSWALGDSAILYSSDRTHTAQIYRHSFTGPGEDVQLTHVSTGVFEPQVGASRIAAATFASDGYHLELLSPTSVTPVARYIDSSAAPNTAPVVVDTSAVLAYSPWRMLVPRYWLPTLTQGIHSEYRLGLETSSNDVVGRHAYDLNVAIPTENTGVTGSFDYRYAGLGLPVIDAIATQDWSAVARIVNRTGTALGEVRRRIRTGEIDASWLRPRARSSATFTVGLGMEERAHAAVPDSFNLAALDTTGALGTIRYPEAIAAATFANYLRPAFSISPEDGVAFGVTSRDRIRSGPTADQGQSFSTVGVLDLYRSLDLPGYAHHVLALRGAAGVADDRTTGYFEVGGTSGGAFQIVPGYTVGEGGRTFPVRGFAPATLIGTRAFTGSAEYRLPLSLARRAAGILPFFFDRTALSLFSDAGTAWCPTAAANREVCTVPALTQRSSIASVGAEMVLGAGVLTWDSPIEMRLGVAHPVHNSSGVSTPAWHVYAVTGISF